MNIGNYITRLKETFVRKGEKDIVVLRPKTPGVMVTEREIHTAIDVFAAFVTTRSELDPLQKLGLRLIVEAARERGLDPSMETDG